MGALIRGPYTRPPYSGVSAMKPFIVVMLIGLCVGVLIHVSNIHTHQVERAHSLGYAEGRLDSALTSDRW